MLVSAGPFSKYIDTCKLGRGGGGGSICCASSTTGLVLRKLSGQGRPTGRGFAANKQMSIAAYALVWPFNAFLRGHAERADRDRLRCTNRWTMTEWRNSCRSVWLALWKRMSGTVPRTKTDFYKAGGRHTESRNIAIIRRTYAIRNRLLYRTYKQRRQTQLNHSVRQKSF